MHPSARNRRLARKEAVRNLISCLELTIYKYKFLDLQFCGFPVVMTEILPQYRIQPHKMCRKERKHYMNKYEVMMVLSCNKDEEALTALIAKLRGIIEQNATIESFDEWGKRRLAYPINYQNDGYYILCHFESNADFPKELTRIFNITDGILRTMIIALED